jgi:hypothetical protein
VLEVVLLLLCSAGNSICRGLEWLVLIDRPMMMHHHACSSIVCTQRLSKLLSPGRVVMQMAGTNNSLIAGRRRTPTERSLHMVSASSSRIQPEGGCHERTTTRGRQELGTPQFFLLPCPRLSNNWSSSTRRFYAAATAKASASKRGGGGGTTKQRKKSNQKKPGKGGRNNNVPSILLSDFEQMVPSSKKPRGGGGRGRGSKGGVVQRMADSDLVALQGMLDSLMLSDDDSDDDIGMISFGGDEDDGDDDDDDDGSTVGQFYQQAVRALQADVAVRSNLGAPIRVGSVTSQSSTTEYDGGRRPRSSHQYAFGVTGANGRATARLNVEADGTTAWVDLELYGGETLNIALNNDNDDTKATIEVGISTSRPFAPALHHRWTEDGSQDIVEAEIVEKNITMITGDNQKNRA